MSDLFLQIVNMSITASYIALAVILLRFLLKKAPKWIMSILWGFVALRLVFPFSIESIFSLIPSAKPIPDGILTTDTPAINSGISILNSNVNSVLQGSLSPNLGDSVNPLQIITFIGAIIWALGVMAMLVYAIFSYFRVKKQVKEAVLICDNIWGCERIATPFILGVIKPKIYLPFLMNEDDREYVISHEKAHLKRCDHIWKPLGFLLLSVYWFNPVMWAAYILLCRDIELACDERVIKQMGNEIKKPYSEALINSSLPRKMIAACPLAFGEVGVKARVKSVLNYKKPTFWVIFATIITLIITAVCLLTNPAGVKLSKIENSNIKAENYQRIYYGDGEAYESCDFFSQKDLKSFLNLRISKTPVSLKRGTDRDKSHILVIQEDMEYYLSSLYPSGLYFCFNEDFSEVFVNDGVKPTLSYLVKNPEKARKLYNRICNRNGIDNGLKAFLDEEIARQNESDNTKGNFVAIDYEIIKLKETDSEVTLYMWVLYEEYSLKNGKLNVEAGSHIPTVITAAKNGEIYDLKEYWQPRDGSYYVKDIRKKFPFHLWLKATDSQWCIDKQTQRCEEKALKYFRQNGNISKNVDNIVDQSKNDPNISFDTAFEEIYRDAEYIYYFSVIKSKCVVVTYTDGTTANVKDALNAGDITITDLDRFGIEYTKERLN